MRLYIDPNYTPPVIKLIKQLHDLEFPKSYEVVTGDWSDNYDVSDTAIFLVDTNKKGLNTITLDQYNEGYNVIAYKKPQGDAFDPFRCSVIMLSQWRRILVELKATNEKVLIAISNGEKPYRTVLPRK